MRKLSEAKNLLLVLDRDQAQEVLEALVEALDLDGTQCVMVLSHQEEFPEGQPLPDPDVVIIGEITVMSSPVTLDQIAAELELGQNPTRN